MTTPTSQDLRKYIRDSVLRRKAELTVRGGDTEPVASAVVYEWNSRIKFGAQTHSRPYMISGWSHDEPGFVWTDGPSALLAMTVTSPPGDVIIKLRARAIVDDQHPVQAVKLRLNGNVVLSWHVGPEDAWYVGRVFYSSLRGKPHLNIAIEPERPTTPRSLGLGEDDRQLGCALSELVLELAS